MALSPDGKSLHFTSYSDNAIVRFGRAVSGILSGRVFDSGHSPVANAPVEVCPKAGGTCVARFSNGSGEYRVSGLENGEYLVTARPPVGLEAENGVAGPVVVEGGTPATQDVTLGQAIVPPPAGIEVGTSQHSAGGIPAVRWGQAVSIVKQHACANATSAKWKVVQGVETIASGSMAEQSPETYVGTILSLQPHTGSATVRIEISCPSGPPFEAAFGLYIDPSGVVRNAATGAPIGGATVTLLRSESSGGPFEQVPDGSAIMSAGNRSNPDTTAADGSFGWDVIAGYYRVRAAASGCNTAETAVLAIPPPVTNLALSLTCPTENPPPPPPPPEEPSNSFQFGKVTLNKKKGTATLAVKVPGPGSLILSGKQVRR